MDVLQPSRFLSEALDQSSRAIAYLTGEALGRMFPERAVIEGTDGDFELYDYVREGLCTVRVKGGVHAQVGTWWTVERGTHETPVNAWYEVDWRGESLDVILMEWDCEPTHFWIVADSERVARGFFEAVCSFRPGYEGEVLVFGGGSFKASSGLYRGAGDSGFDDLVLPGRMKEEIRGDLERFYAGREVYERLRAPWKRGILLTGPPGNGKTHTIKALVGELGKPVIYVKSFKSERWAEETAIQRIFQKARAVAPCLLVMEDLDALVTEDNRSFLLNELDGFARNAGIATIATTNHPEKLDPALRERPSRFDRRFVFAHPEIAERRAFLELWAGKLPEGERPGEAAIERAAEETEGFSFASLKELFVGAVLERAGGGGAMGEALLGRLGELRRSVGPSSAERRDGTFASDR